MASINSFRQPLGRRIRVVPEPVAEALIADAQEVARMINGLVRALER
jgi:hypothetical protein